MSAARASSRNLTFLRSEQSAKSDVSLAGPETIRSAGPVASGRLARVAALVGALNAGDVEGATSCFLARGVFVTPDATEVHGHDGVRALLAQLVASGLRIGVEADRTPSGRGHLSQRWRVRRGLAATRSFEQVLHPLFGMSRVGEDWKVAFLAPWWEGQPGQVTPSAPRGQR
jgi:hypothetical protein